MPFHHFAIKLDALQLVVVEEFQKFAMTQSDYSLPPVIVCLTDPQIEGGIPALRPAYMHERPLSPESKLCATKAKKGESTDVADS